MVQGTRELDSEGSSSLTGNLLLKRKLRNLALLVIADVGNLDGLLRALDVDLTLIQGQLFSVYRDGACRLLKV